MAIGRFFRSAHLGNASPEDRERLRAIGISTIVDLRTSMERLHFPNAAWETVRALECHEAEAFEAPHIEATRSTAQNGSLFHSYMRDFYVQFPMRPPYVEIFRAYFEALRQSDEAILVHCSAGKDRTGSLVALTQRLAGVHPDDIMSDYLATNALLEDAVYMKSQTQVMERFAGGPVDPEFVMLVASVHHSYLDSFWAGLKANFGSFEGYLEQVLGLGAQARDEIRDKLTVTA